MTTELLMSAWLALRLPLLKLECCLEGWFSHTVIHMWCFSPQIKFWKYTELLKRTGLNHKNFYYTFNPTLRVTRQSLARPHVFPSGPWSKCFSFLWQFFRLSLCSFELLIICDAGSSCLLDRWFRPYSVSADVGGCYDWISFTRDLFCVKRGKENVMWGLGNFSGLKKARLTLSGSLGEGKC